MDKNMDNRLMKIMEEWKKIKCFSEGCPKHKP